MSKKIQTFFITFLISIPLGLAFETPDYFRFSRGVNKTFVMEQLDSFNFSILEDYGINRVYFRNIKCYEVNRLTGEKEDIGGKYQPWANNIVMCLQSTIDSIYDDLAHEAGHLKWFNYLKPSMNSSLCKWYMDCDEKHIRWYGVPNSENYAIEYEDIYGRNRFLNASVVNAPIHLKQPDSNGGVWDCLITGFWRTNEKKVYNCLRFKNCRLEQEGRKYTYKCL